MIQTNHGINTASVRGSTHFFPGSGGGGYVQGIKWGRLFFFLVTLLGKFNYFEFSRGFFFGGGGSGHAHGQSSIGTCGRNRLLKSTHKIRGLNKDPFCNTWTVLDHWQTAIGEQSAKATGVKRSSTCIYTFTPI